MKKILIIVAVVLVLLIVGGVAVFMFVFKDKEKPIVYSEYEIGEVYTNIADPGKILKFNMVIEYTDPEILETITLHKTEIINNVYELFRGKSFEVLNKKNGQQRVRDEIRDMVIEILETDGEVITNVYFLQFIIQG